MSSSMHLHLHLHSLFQVHGGPSLLTGGPCTAFLKCRQDLVYMVAKRSHGFTQ